MTSNEQAIREQLGVPVTASSVMILGMDAHMDWDWLNTFQTLVYTGNGGAQGAVVNIISQAWQLMIANQQPAAPYRYSVCEIGFLRAALELNPDLVTQFHDNDLSKQLSIEGGGITSPDNLLSHGEAFIRNYLVGWSWLQETLGLSSTYSYLPDDFGHDVQLPVMLEAMGLTGVCFSRVPGSSASSQLTPLQGTSIWTQLMTNGADLFWQGSDGSSVQAHLEQNSYCQGNSLSSYCSNLSGAITQLQSYLNYNKPSSLSPYIYLPCGCDFALPIPCLLEMAAAWNAQSPPPSTYMVVGTLEHYMELVGKWSSDHPGVLVSRSLDPTPYWTGCYASRPANKILHQTTVRALLGAEVFGTIADLLQVNDALAWAPVVAARQESIAQGWEALLPSTHHDYITGTAVDSVYTEEQVPLLRAARSIALGARQTAIQEIAPLVGASPASGETPVAVFNQNGFAMNGIVEIPARPGLTATSVRSESSVVGPVQTTKDGKLLFQASSQSLGYATYYLSDQPNSSSPVTATIEGNVITLKNSQMEVIISDFSRWGVTALRPIVNGVLQRDIFPNDEGGNILTFYKDLGNIYNFGNEYIETNFQVVTGTVTLKSGPVVESGPLSARVEVQITFTDGASSSASTSSADYTLEYVLMADEPFLRMAVTGSVPLTSDPQSGGTPYAVMVRFPFAGSNGNPAIIDGVTRGTPYHWYDQLPVPYWHGPTFQATHNFVIPTVGGTTLAALYHTDIPAWAIDDDGAMIGCILRNTPGGSPWPYSPEHRGANGSDFGVHTHRYALRIPQGLDMPSSGAQVFEESFGFASPLLGSYINVPSEGISGYSVDVSFPTDFSLAAVTSGDAVITVAKEGEFDPTAVIIRLYGPSVTASAPQTVTVSLEGYIQATGNSSPVVTPVTALEQPIESAQPLTVTNKTFTITMNRAIATLAIT